MSAPITATPCPEESPVWAQTVSPPAVQTPTSAAIAAAARLPAHPRQLRYYELPSLHPVALRPVHFAPGTAPDVDDTPPDPALNLPSPPSSNNASMTSSGFIPQPVLSRATTGMTFASLRSLDVDYATIDRDDANFAVTRLQSFALFGVFSRFRVDENDARYQAIQKLNTILSQHGLADLTFNDFVRAIRIFIVLYRRKSKAKVKAARAILKYQQNTVTAAPEEGSSDVDNDAHCTDTGCCHRPTSIDSEGGRIRTGLANRISRSSRTQASLPPAPNPRDAPEHHLNLEHVQLLHHMVRCMALRLRCAK
jgi:hypothetical protein